MGSFIKYLSLLEEIRALERDDWFQVQDRTLWGEPGTSPASRRGSNGDMSQGHRGSLGGPYWPCVGQFKNNFKKIVAVVDG